MVSSNAGWSDLMQMGGLPSRCNDIISIFLLHWTRKPVPISCQGCCLYCKLWFQGDRSRLGLRGSASSEFVPTLSTRDESEVIFPQMEQEQERRDVQTENLSLNRLSGGQVSVTIERQQTPMRLGGVLVANEQVVGPPCTARSIFYQKNRIFRKPWWLVFF